MIKTESVPATLHADSVFDFDSASESIDFSCEANFYPLGFPLHLVSNSHAVLQAAEKSWSCFNSIFQDDPLEMRVAVKSDSKAPGILPPEPLHSLQGDFLVNFADIDNYFIANLARGLAACRVTEAAVSSALYLRYHMLEAAALSMITAIRAVAIHAACVIVQNRGILLCGDSGAGKSTLAYAGARSGWTYVSDDASYMPLNRSHSVVGNCHQIRFRPSAAELFPEIKGFSITPRASGKPSIEIQMTQWRGISTSGMASVNYVIFLNRSKTSNQELVRVSPDTVLPWFAQHVLTTADSRGAQEAALSRLLKSTVFELRYHDLSWAIERINRLAEKGRC